jgi:alkaline phosphatase D
MRLLSLSLALISLSTLLALAGDVSPITPAEAAKKVNEKVVVEMEVKSTGGRNNVYLNSEKDFMDAKNFTVFISKDLLEKFKKAGVDSPATYYKEKVIQVTGTVVLENQKPWIKISDPDQIKLVAKEKK